MKETNREYAEALFAIAKEKKCLAEYSESLKEIYALLEENPEYTEFLASPALALSERLSAIDKAFESAPEYVVSFVKLLCENGHIREIKECINQFLCLEMLEKNSITVKVCSSIALDDEQKSRLEAKLEAKYKKQITAEYVIDETLIGGIKIIMEDKVLDGSTSKCLKNLKEVIE